MASRSIHYTTLEISCIPQLRGKSIIFIGEVEPFPIRFTINRFQDSQHVLLSDAGELSVFNIKQKVSSLWNHGSLFLSVDDRLNRAKNHW